MARLDEPLRFPLRHLGLGLIIRELLAPWTGHPYDFEIWIRLGFYAQNWSNPYRTLPYVPGLSFSPIPQIGSISYPPFSPFIFALTYRLYVFLGAPSRFLYYFLLKQPMVLADIGVALVLAKIILMSGDTRSARTAFSIWIYFPLGIIISAVWGQLDPISLFLSLLAIYFFLSSKFLPSATMLGLSIYLKTLPVVFLPIFLLQPKLIPRKKVIYTFASLTIPVVGTVLPPIALNWDYHGIYNNISYQIAIPSTGAMSLLGQVHLVTSLLPLPNPYTGILWVPVTLAAYAYSWRKSLPLFQGLLISILAFSISRPFLPEQWSLYPLALLLLLVRTLGSLDHFVGLAVSTTAFLATHNTLLVVFLSPVSLAAFNWDIFINNQSPYVSFRSGLLLLTALLYFTESVLVLVGRESYVYRAIAYITPGRFKLKSRVAPMEVNLA